ncbi:hypothetical protein LCGC14_0812160 [marine sediment metagenome]|uniref:Uncharacterized protein n=1 Tax=marine sediment metagenome TaxID=412755 RepID=A0A0F9STN2_9ZZZZ
MTEKQRDQLMGLVSKCHPGYGTHQEERKLLRFVERLELEARLDEIQKCRDIWETHGLHEIVHDVPGIRGAMNGYEYSLTQRLGGLQAQLKGEHETTKG